MGRTILVFGGTRGTGLEAIKLLVARGDRVTVMVRPASNRGGLEPLNVNIVEGDALDRASVEAAFAAAKPAAVINSLGGKRGEPRPDLEGTINIVDAAEAAGVRRIVMVTAVGAGDSTDALSPNAWKFLGPVIELKTQAENRVTGSDLDYTILRPGGMGSDPATGTAIRTDDHSVMGMINRADLGRLVVECLDDDSTIGHIYHATDPGIDEQPPLQRGEPLGVGPKP
jgi:uncharacterized protein YbjT (DUF2867 family)